MHPEWSPLGAERFTQIVADGGYFPECAGKTSLDVSNRWTVVRPHQYKDPVTSTPCLWHAGGYDGTVIYRVVKDQAVQFGYLKDEALRKKWQHEKDLQDEPQVFRDPNFHRGMISFAGGGTVNRIRL